MVPFEPNAREAPARRLRASAANVLARREFARHLVDGRLIPTVMRNDRWFPSAGLLSSTLVNWEAPAPCRRSHAGAAVRSPPCAPLPPRRPILPFVLPGRCAVRLSFGCCGAARATRRSGVVFHHLGPCLDQTGDRPLRPHFALCSRRTRGGCDKSVDGVAFLEWTKPPRACQLKASTAGPPIPTMTMTSRCLKVKHTSLSTSATNCCNLFVVETRLFGFKACEVSVCAACLSVPCLREAARPARQTVRAKRPFQAKRRMEMRRRSGPEATVSRGLGYWFSSIFSELGARPACSPPCAGFCLSAAAF
jgi:hypothetical protein